MQISAKELSQLAEQAVKAALSYWSTLGARLAYPQTNGVKTEALFSKPWPEIGKGLEVLDDFAAIADSSRPSGGKFFGYVFGSGDPVGAIGEFLSAVLNQNVAAWRSSPAATSIERTVIGWIADAVGCTGFTGSLCGGGSAANLMALAMARESRLPANETGAKPCTIYASEQVHMSIPKAVALLGIGRKNLKLIPVSSALQIRMDALERQIAADREAGLTPIAIVANAGTVNTGAIDPLLELARLAKREDLWLHVDGAFGGLAALAIPEKFEGLSSANSLSLDAHKWLYQPVDCGCLLYRDPQIARLAFSQSADYVKVLTEEPTEIFTFFDESIELSRRFRALKLWMSLQYHGRRAFREAISRDLRHAQTLVQEIQARAGLELLAPVPLSAVCFRHRTLDNAAILKRINARGRVYLSNAVLSGQFALRACFVNHLATDSDVHAIVPEVMAAAEEIAM